MDSNISTTCAKKKLNQATIFKNQKYEEKKPFFLGVFGTMHQFLQMRQIQLILFP